MSYKNLTELKPSVLESLGFVIESDGSGNPRGDDWNYRTNDFHLSIDCYGEFKLRRDGGSVYVTIEVENLEELQNLLDFINE